MTKINHISPTEHIQEKFEWKPVLDNGAINGGIHKGACVLRAFLLPSIEHFPIGHIKIVLLVKR